MRRTLTIRGYESTQNWMTLVWLLWTERCAIHHLEGTVNNSLVKDTLPRADSPTSLFSAPSSPDVPLIDSLSSPVPTTTTSNMPSTGKIFSQQLNPPSGSGISIKQRLGLGALAPTNPKTGPFPLPTRPMSKPLPPSLAGIKIKKKNPSLSISTNANPASGHEPSLISASMTMHSPHPISNMSPNIPNSTPVFTPNFYRHVTPNETPNETMCVSSPFFSIW